MPVRKFRNVEEMNAFDRERQLRIGDPRIADRIRATFEMTRGLNVPLDLPKGVHKFRSIEDMNAFKEKYEQRRIARIAAERVKK